MYNKYFYKLIDCFVEFLTSFLWVFSDLSRVRLLMEINHERTVKFHCVSDGWVKECVDLGALRSERTFQVVS